MTHGILSDRLKVAQAELVQCNVKSNLIASVVASSIMVLMLMQAVPSPFLIPWYVCFLVVIGCRYYAQVYRFEKVALNPDNVDGMLRSMSFLVFLSGCMWGSLGYVVINIETPLISAILLTIFTAVVANASATMASVMPIYLYFAFPVLGLSAVKFYSFDNQQYEWVTVLIVVYFLVTYINTKRIGASLHKSIMLDFENVDLVENLRIQNSKTEDALDKAKQANMAKSRFFAAASHDLRQPLQSLSMFTTTLASQIETAPQKQIVSHIDNSVRSLESLFNALLDISTLDAGTLKINRQHFYLKPLVDELSVGFLESSLEKKLTYEVNVDNYVLHSDPLLLSRVVQNLIENSIRYTLTGGVVISTQCVDNKVYLSIADTGIGIPDDKRSRIFEEFVQLSNTGQTRSEGLGLGLSIVSRICNLLHMPLNVESNAGKGSTFSVGIELGDAALVETKDTRNSVFPSTLDGMFVLVVDDEQDIQLAMEGLLSVWGCTVMVASSGEEAVQQLIEYESCPDAVITDYRLQDNETGADALDLIRKHSQSNVPAIIVTGDIAPDRLLEIDKLGLPVLHKPCNADQLQNYLCSILTTTA